MHVYVWAIYHTTARGTDWTSGPVFRFWEEQRCLYVFVFVLPDAVCVFAGGWRECGIDRGRACIPTVFSPYSVLWSIFGFVTDASSSIHILETMILFNFLFDDTLAMLGSNSN